MHFSSGFVGIALSLFASLSFAKSSTAIGLFDNAEGSPVISIIQQAKKSLDIEIYEMDDPGVLAAIRGALDRSVKVRIVKEPTPVGASCRVFEAASDDDAALDDGMRADCADQKKLVKEVRRAGGTYVPFKKNLCGEAERASCVEHGKLVIADNQRALISSGNFNTSSLCSLAHKPSKCNRDYSYVTTSPAVVKTLKKVVDKDVKGLSYDVGSIFTGDSEKALTVGPNSLQPLVDFINSARTSILLENQYLKDPTMNAALVNAAERGVDVKISLASACSFGKPSATEAKKLTAIFSEFDAAGIQTRMFTKNQKINGKPGYLHAKAIVVDGERAWMGSVNGSTQATTRNREFGIFFDDTANVDKLNSQIVKDFKHTKSETWRQSLNCDENDLL